MKDEGELRGKVMCAVAMVMMQLRLLLTGVGGAPRAPVQRTCDDPPTSCVDTFRSRVTCMFLGSLPSRVSERVVSRYREAGEDELHGRELFLRVAATLLYIIYLRATSMAS